MNILKKAQFVGHNGAVYALSRYIQPNSFLSAAGDGWIVAWDLNDPDHGRLLTKTDSNIFSIVYLPSKNWLIAGNMYGGLHWIDLENGNNFKSVQHHKNGVFALFCLNDKEILSLGGDGILTKWDIEKSIATESLVLSSKSLRAISKHPKLDLLAIAASDSNIYLLNSQNLELVRKIENAHDNSVFSLCFSPDGEYLLSGGRDAYLRIRLSNNNFEELPTQAAHLFTVNDIAYHPNGKFFATASRDKTIRIWDAVSFVLLKVIDSIRNAGHLKSVNRLLWVDDVLISCSDDRSIIAWEVKG
jgi:WD40 repeat protein